MARWEINPNWTGEKAIAEEIRWLDSGKPDGRVRGPLEAWKSLSNIQRCHERYLTGDKGAVLDAIAACALDDLVLPDWLAQAFLSAHRKVVHYQSKDWNGVFGPAHKKGTNLNAKRKRRELAPALLNRAIELAQHNPSTAIDNDFYEQLGKEFNIGKSLAQEYIAWWSKVTGLYLNDVVEQIRSPLGRPASNQYIAGESDNKGSTG